MCIVHGLVRGKTEPEPRGFLRQHMNIALPPMAEEKIIAGNDMMDRQRPLQYLFDKFMG